MIYLIISVPIHQTKYDRTMSIAILEQTQVTGVTMEFGVQKPNLPACHNGACGAAAESDSANADASLAEEERKGHTLQSVRAQSH
jgi:hypothetical protein